MRRRPAAAPGLLRPAAAPRRGRGKGEAEESPEEVRRKYDAGEKVRGEKIAPGGYQRGDWLLLEDAVYFKQVIQLAGKVVKEELEGGERELHLELTGTKSEQLLQFGTGPRPAAVRVHLCRVDCPQTRANPDLVHGQSVQKIPEGGAKTWETNLVVESNMDLLQADHERWKKEEEERKRKQARSTSSSRAKKKKKKKKKDKKEVKSGEREAQSPERIKARIGSKAHAKKGLEMCFGNTGLDPNPKIRKRIAKKAKKAVKRAKDSSSSTSSSSTSEASSGDPSGLLEDRSKVHRLAARAPGVLTASSVATMSQFLNQTQGTGWEPEASGVPPLLGLYNRVYLASRLTGGLQREFQTLCYCGDLLLQGRLAETLDVMVQRLNSLEMIGQGTPWQTAQKLELVPPVEAAISTRQEHQLARKEAKLDQAVKGGAPSSASDKGKSKGKGKTFEKGKDKNKGKPKEGDSKKTP